MFAVLARIWEDGVLPVWEEASSFLDRLVVPGERVSPQQFVERVHRWVESLRTDSEVLASYKADLEPQTSDSNSLLRLTPPVAHAFVP